MTSNPRPRRPNAEQASAQGSDLIGGASVQTSLDWDTTRNHRGQDTSIAAAADAAIDAKQLRGLALEHIRKTPSTADEVADALGKSVLSIRPRITELKNLGKIVDTGDRRKNTSGKSAKVWKAI